MWRRLVGGTSTPPSTTYTVGGKVSGLSNGQTVTLQNNGGDDLTVNANGTFIFASALAQGASYAVTVSQRPTGQTCSVTNGTGTIGSSNVTTVHVTCLNLGLTVLHSFGGGNDGVYPLAALTQDAQGNLYGTTFYGGTSNNGTLFKLAPNGQGGYTESVLYSFAGGTTDGAYPYTGLILGSDSALYGTTANGDAVFRFVP